jgi:hypothetical protein
MEKYILLIILIAFVIYIFCSRKKDLIEGALGSSEEEETLLRDSLKAAGVADSEVDRLGERELLEYAGNRGKLTDAERANFENHYRNAGGGHNIADIDATDWGALTAERNNPTGGGETSAGGGETSAGGGETSAGGGETSGGAAEPSAADENAVLASVQGDASATKNLDKYQENSNVFTDTMAGNEAGVRKLNEKDFKVVEGPPGEYKITKNSRPNKGREITPGERRKLYEELEEGVGDGAEYVTRTRPAGVTPDMEAAVESKLTRLREAGGNHPYIALGLGVIGAILFTRESAEDCIATCASGEADDDWKKNHGVEDTYSENCPGDTCADFCSASGEGECSIRQRNEASVHEITHEVVGAAEEGLDAVLGELWEILAGIGAIPFMIVCCIFISIPVGMIIYSMITSKVSSVKQSVLNTGGVKGDVIRKSADIYGNKTGGGNLKKLNSPKVIILIVFFIFIVYNGRR